MFARTLRGGSAVLIATLFIACDQSPTDPTLQSSRLVASSAAATSLAENGDGAWREVTEDLYDLSDVVVSFPCGDGFTEDIKMRGQLFWRSTVTVDGAGGLHTVLHTMPIGMGGVGLTTGADYRIAQTESSVFNTAMGEAGYYQHSLRVSAPELRLQLRLVIGGRFTTNANGAVVVERPILRADCKGSDS